MALQLRGSDLGDRASGRGERSGMRYQVAVQTAAHLDALLHDEVGIGAQCGELEDLVEARVRAARLQIVEDERQR